MYNLAPHIPRCAKKKVFPIVKLCRSSFGMSGSWALLVMISIGLRRQPFVATINKKLFVVAGVEYIPDGKDENSYE